MQLRPYQQRAVDSIYSYFREKRKGDPLVCLPTGSGKSIVIADFIKGLQTKYPKQRVLMLTHVKELVEQNAKALKKWWPEADIGIYSAGLKSRDLGHAVTMAGIQSVYKKHLQLGWKDLILIDECHLIGSNSDSMYMTLIENMKKVNPNLKVVGFTATPFRTKGGMLTDVDNAIFGGIAIDVGVKELVDEGYLSNLISKSGVTQADLSSVGVSNGDFNVGRMQKEFDQSELTHSAIKEFYKFGKGRGKLIVFCSGVHHARSVAKILNEEYSIPTGCVVGDTPHEEREKIISDYKSGKLSCITNCGVLTTGFDNPSIDVIMLLRGTKSAGLYIQMLGRGMRISPGKENCLVLDFGGNIERFGPIDKITIARKGKKTGISITPMKPCENPECRCPNNVSVRECVECGHPFLIAYKPAHDKVASGAAIMSEQNTQADYFEVSDIFYKTHSKDGKPDSMKVTYVCGLADAFNEWVCVAHGGYAERKAQTWWSRISSEIMPLDADKAVSISKGLRRPVGIYVRKNGKYKEIVGYEFEK